ncbi:MAG: caspase family protein [Betaproteobacteria bacterium]|nr:caspase family protein [Betaproteobacteria bacterium]
MSVRRALLASLLLISALHGMQSGAQAQSPGAAAVEPVAQAEISEIRQAFQGIGLREADVVRGQDGRITLVGEYENRDAVETAFAAARAVVGLRRVAPTTPGNIKYRLRGFDTAFASTVGKMMQRSQPKAEPAATPAPPPRPAVRFQRGARTYGLVMGIGKFKYLPESHGLEYADKDAFDFFTFLISPQGGGLTRDAIKLLRQEEATSAAVKTAMREIFDLTQAGDTVVLFAASHGLPNAMNKFDIVLHDTEFPKHKTGPKEQPLDFVITKRSTALADDDLQNWVTQLTLRDVRTVVILDTCYSGKTFVSIPGYLPARTRSLSRHKKEVEYSASLSQEALNELAQQAKDARTTRIVIVSASENEESMESLKSNGGLFTQTYIAALANAHDYADAFDQAKPSVIRSARTVGHSQTPRLLAVPESAVTKM